MASEEGSDDGEVFDSLQLFLTESSRQLEFAPARVTVGLVQLHAWQVRAIPFVSPGLEGHATYLIKVAYDLRLARNSPLERLDIGFEFVLDDSLVLDALPYATDQREPRRTFRLSPMLQFVPDEDPARPGDGLPSGLVVPASAHDIEVSGVGSNAIGWRLRPSRDAPLRAGSYSHWIVLLTDPGQQQVAVLATSGYDLPEPTRKGMRAGGRSAAFTIDLPAPGPTRDPGRPAGALTTPRPGARRRAFISYAHDTAGHKAAVVRLAELLRAEPDLEVHLDQWVGRRRQNWQRWMITTMMDADFVIVIASPEYRKVSEYRMADSEHHGVQAEYSFLTDQLASAREKWTRKILPVVLPGRAIDDIPIAFEPQNSDRYVVPQLDAAGVKDLLETLMWDETPRDPDVGS
jgi:hypothetical protein